MKGQITLTSHRTEPADVEVTRYVLGTADTANPDGKLDKLNVFEDSDAALSASHPWWNWYGWPAWWNHVNGIGRITWKLRIEPRKPVDLEYSWHYFWR